MKLNKPKSKLGCSKRKWQKYKRTREILRKGFNNVNDVLDELATVFKKETYIDDVKLSYPTAKIQTIIQQDKPYEIKPNQFSVKREPIK